MLKIIKFLSVLVLIFILLAAFSRHTLCRFLISNAVAKAAGLKLSIEDLNLDVLSNTLSMRGITLFNPPGFRNEVLGKAKEIFIKYNPLGFASGRLHLRQVKADISEINIIRNEKGSSNVSTFKKKKFKAKSSTDTSSTSPAQKKPKGSKGKTHPKFLIDSLEVSLEKATYVDYKAEVGQPAVIIFTVKGPCVFKNVSDLGYVVDSVSVKGGFKNLLNNLSEIVPRDLFKTTTKKIKKKIEDAFIHKTR